ncbi:MAG: hypothetical protein HYV63_30270 [Candidatus Schekmanbacteria bacterium]|nr:hypothetical protein [Candidatus Schekmanbacteria bacterium]
MGAAYAGVGRGGRWGSWLAVMAAVAAVVGAAGAQTGGGGMAIELPPAPAGGYMSPPPPFWGKRVLVQGKVKSASPWWVEVCTCNPKAGACPDLELKDVKPLEQRLRELDNQAWHELLTMWCGPTTLTKAEQNKVVHKIMKEKLEPGWWFDVYAHRAGAEMFGEALESAMEGPQRRFAFLFFNDAGDRAVRQIDIQLHPEWDAKQRGNGIGSWFSSPDGLDPSSSGPTPAEGVRFTTDPHLQTVSDEECDVTSIQIDWEGDGEVDLRMTCRELRILEAEFTPTVANKPISHLYTEVGFWRPTLIVYEGDKVVGASTPIVEVDLPPVRRDIRGSIRQKPAKRSGGGS